MNPTTETKREMRAVIIPADLHAALKQLARQRGMKISALAEFKLRELLEPQQLELAEVAK